MNGTHVRSKLKIRNRILAIAVAFLLLTLMVPNMSFADGTTDQSKDIAAEEVNNAEDAAAAANEGEPAANAVTVTGTITDGANHVSGAIVYAYQGVNKMGSSNNTGSDGKFTLPLNESVQLGDKVMLKVVCVGYGFEVLDFTVAADAGEIALKAASPTTIKPFTEQDERHSTYTIEASIDGVLQSSEIYDNEKTFSYNLPADGQLTMTDRAHLYYNYTNTRNQEVSLHIIANGADLYKAFWWGIQSSDSELEDEMVVNQPYILTASVTYTVAVWYQGLAMLDFSSASDHHDYFDINYVKNGAPYVNLQQASFKNTTFDGATCKLCDDGRIEIFFDSTDEFNTYKVVGYITPVAKAGYKLANWTYNGETLKAGEEILAKQGLNMAFVANYEVDASKAPATGDFSFVWIITLSGLALASAAGALRFRKNR